MSQAWGGDHAELRGGDAEFGRDHLVGLGCGLVAADGFYGEDSFEERREAGVGELRFGNGGRRVGERHHAESEGAQAAEGRGDFGVRGQSPQSCDEFARGVGGERHGSGGGDHLQGGLRDFAEVAVIAGESQGFGVEDYLVEPFVEDGGVGEGALEEGAESIEVKEGFVDVEDQDAGHVGVSVKSPRLRLGLHRYSIGHEM
jgi:hypothetical protein